jgi:AcrR family transcriptional regulator
MSEDDKRISTGSAGDRPAGRAVRGSYHHGDLRAALVAAAEAELIERGIEGFSLRSVAKRAGVSHAAPAHHFKDTVGLLTALAAEAARRLVASMQTALAEAPPDPAGRIVASGIGYVDFALANPAMFDLLFGSKRPDSQDETLVRHASEAFALLFDELALLYGDDPLVSADGRRRTATAWALVHGIAQLLIAGRMKFLQEDLRRDRRGTLAGLLNGALGLEDAGRPSTTTSD